MYQIFSNEMLIEDSVCFPWKKLWQKAVPIKVIAFSWKVVHERIPSKENLLKRGISTEIDRDICSLFFSALESSNHLRFTCPSAILVWNAKFELDQKICLIFLVCKGSFPGVFGLGTKCSQKKVMGFNMTKYYLGALKIQK